MAEIADLLQDLHDREGTVAECIALVQPTITHIDGQALAKKKAQPSVICPSNSCGNDGGDGGGTAGIGSRL
jgi:hypothetical protein